MSPGQVTERILQQKLPVWRVIRQTFDYLGDHGWRMLATAPQLAAVLFAGSFLGMSLNQIAVAQRSILLEAAGWLTATAAPVLAAVAWHRLILLDEPARAGLTAGKPERAYFIVLATSSALVFALTILSHLIALLTAGFESLHAPAMVLLLIIVLVPAYFFGHFFLALPQAALTGTVNVRQIAALTRGNKLRLLAVAILPIPILLLMELVRIFLLQMARSPSAGFYIYSSVATLVVTLLSVTTMSISYRTLALSPTEDAADMQARETAGAEG